MRSKGRTEFQMNLSGAKNIEEADLEVCFLLTPPKSGQNYKKRIIFSIDFQTLMALQYFDGSAVHSHFDSE